MVFTTGKLKKDSHAVRVVFLQQEIIMVSPTGERENPGRQGVTEP